MFENPRSNPAHQTSLSSFKHSHRGLLGETFSLFPEIIKGLSRGRPGRSLLNLTLQAAVNPSAVSSKLKVSATQRCQRRCFCEGLQGRSNGNSV